MRSNSLVMVLAVSLMWTAGAYAQEKSVGAQVSGDKKAIEHFCEESGTVTFTGSDNTIDVHGACGTVIVKGARNKVVIDVTENLQLQGDDNTVAWDASHIGLSEPKALIAGARNSIKRQE